MFYKNLELEVKNDIVILKNPDSFIPSHIFENGQCFRWNKVKEEHYRGVVEGRVLEVQKKDKDILLYNTNIDDFKDIWYEYFDFETDYNKIKKKIAVDDFSKKAIEFAKGLRILKQNYFEVFISFIISQNNNIPRIKKIIEALCREYGDKIEYKGEIYYSFVNPIKFKDINVKQISFCKAGYRCKYLSEISKIQIPDKDMLKKISLKEEREILNKVKGIGPKVADCILLFSGINRNAFPIDVWIKRVIKEIYKDAGNRNEEIYEFFKKIFKNQIGIAQQYLFYYAREKKKI